MCANFGQNISHVSGEKSASTPTQMCCAKRLPFYLIFWPIKHSQMKSDITGKMFLRDQDIETYHFINALELLPYPFDSFPLYKDESADLIVPETVKRFSDSSQTATRWSLISGWPLQLQYIAPSSWSKTNWQERHRIYPLKTNRLGAFKAAATCQWVPPSLLHQTCKRLGQTYNSNNNNILIDIWYIGLPIKQWRSFVL